MVVITVLNGRMWWKRAQYRFRSDPDLEPGYRRLYRGYLFWTNLPWLTMGVGILSGQVPSIFHFLLPRQGNTFVLAWWVGMAMLLFLCTYWIIIGGGAETLEKHPGVHGVPRWSASMLRIFWLGVVAWNIVIAVLLFFGNPRTLIDPEKSPSTGPWLTLFFPVFFLCMWLLVSLLISAMGGWRSLSEHYAARIPFSGKRLYFRSAQFGGYVNYGGCLTLGAGPSGLHLAVLPLFRMAHPPLLIPWSDIKVSEVRGWIFTAIEIHFVKVPGISVRLSPKLAQKLFDASGTRILVANQNKTSIAK